MARGGRRSGTPGKAYGERTDLGMDRAGATQKTYGDVARLDRAQAAVPVPEGSAAALPGPGGSSPTPALPPGSLTGLTDPSQRPDEPLTAGLSTGPGPGPSPMAGGSEQGLSDLRARNAHYLEFLAGRDDLPDRVARFVRLVRNSA